jgi:hypothetical protein
MSQQDGCVFQTGWLEIYCFLWRLCLVPMLSLSALAHSFSMLAHFLSKLQHVLLLHQHLCSGCVPAFMPPLALCTSSLAVRHPLLQLPALGLALCGLAPVPLLLFSVLSLSGPTLSLCAPGSALLLSVL